MKVYVYEKKDNHKRIATFVNVLEVKSNKKYFIITTDTLEEFAYEKKDFMISVYGY